MSATTFEKGRASGGALAREELAAWRGFLRAHAAITRQLDSELVERHGLSLSSYEVLLYLSAAPAGSMRMSELADSVLLSRSGLTRLVDRLERDALAKREACPSDARGSNARITPAGREAFAAARRTHLSGVRERFLGRFSEAELVALGELWERIEPGATGCGLAPRQSRYLNPMPTEPAPLTLAAAVRRAVGACDPAAETSASAEVLERFEDRDEPIASLEDPEVDLAEAFGAIDPQEEDATVQMIRVVATYLAFRRDQTTDSDGDLLRLAARAEYDGSPPEPVRAWLEEREVRP